MHEFQLITSCFYYRTYVLFCPVNSFTAAVHAYVPGSGIVTIHRQALLKPNVPYDNLMAADFTLASH